MIQQYFNFGRKSLAKKPVTKRKPFEYQDLKVYYKEASSAPYSGKSKHVRFIDDVRDMIRICHKAPSRQQARDLIKINTNEDNLNIEREITNENKNV